MSLPREQFEPLALAQLDALYRMARNLTRDSHQAEDLVQETFARALRSRERFQLHEFGIKPWLLRIMHNLHLNRSGREKRQPIALPPEILDAPAPSNETIGPLDPASFQAMDQEIVQALDQLPDDYRAVMLLWAIEEMSYKEIAAILDIPIGTVMSRLHRTRQRLADQLRQFATEEGMIRSTPP
jgi:RNA polymerase sigma-70 factor (ECF subfamily)